MLSVIVATCDQVYTEYKEIAASVLYDVLHDPDFRQSWDKHMLQSVEVGYLNPNNDISYYAGMDYFASSRRC